MTDTPLINYFIKTLFKLFVSLFVLFPLGYNGQTKFDTELLTDHKKNGPAIASQLNTIELLQYPDTLKNCIYLKNGFRSSKFLNEDEWHKLKDSVEVYRIDIVYSKYPLHDGVYKEIYPLLFSRLTSLFEMDHSLNDAAIQWNKVLQTNCINDAQVSKLFHGVVIWYRTTEEPQITIAEAPLTKSGIIEREENKLISEQMSLEELTQSVDNIKSSTFIPDSLRKELEKQSLSSQIKTIKQFLEKEIAKEPDIDLSKATESEKKNYDKEIESFLKKYPATDKVVTEVMNRHPEWKNAIVINDWTGSMYGYGAQILQWHLANFEKSGIMSLTLFNDGDNKSTGDKRIGETEGIYSAKADNILKLVKLFNYIMLKGGGGDGPENDVEGILHAMEEYEHYSEIILIADNNACIRDIELADRIGKPVKVIICGYRKEYGINPDLVYLAKQTGGGIYTIEDDIENITAELGTKGEITSLLDTRFKITRKKCSDLDASSFDEISDFKFAKHHKRRIRHLNLENKALNDVPGVVYRMSKLNKLNLSHNNIESISERIEQLEFLKTLNLSYNKLKELPVHLRRVLFIEEIDLSHNNFTSLPGPVLGMKFLITLDLSFNQISKIDKNINLRKVERLNLSNNSISEVSKPLGQLKNVKTLDLSNNQITGLPDNLSNMSKLRELDLSNNRLRQLPPHIGRLKNLQVLHLEGNEFPEEERERIQNALPNATVYF